MSHAKYNRITARSAVAAKTIDTKKEANARRELLTKAALAAGTAALAGSVAKKAWGQTPAPVAAPAPAANAALQSDLGILNFALTLEYLEAAFYTQVVAADTAVQYLRGRLRQLAPVLRDHEVAHVEALTATITKLGGTPVARPTFRFPPETLISPVTFARFAYTLEEIGAGAYLGAVGKIQNDDVRRAAASIYGTETRHVALLRHLGGYSFAPRYYEGPLTVEQVQGLIAPYIVA